ncbi:MAG: hypothetical protein JSV42_15790 [Chloroflexota bacterium]|nr:MAG: hypothetical protein JSV42_15790 [Chloroflexota bacterium]
MMKNHLHLDEPAKYRIQVQGILGQQWSESMGGLEISVTGSQDQPVTTLTGELLDQAALMGVLNGLYSLGYALLSVEYQSLSS